MNFSRDLEQAMRESAERAYPQEACGFIVKKGKKTLVVEAVNSSAFPLTQFLIRAEDYAAASDVGEILGIWHTHCDIPAKASDADLAGCEASGIPWYILAVSKEGETHSFSEIVAVTPTGFEMPYLERPYIFGIFDCYSLVCDYYQREYSIKLGHYPHIEDWWKKGYDFFTESYKKEGFDFLIDQEPKVGDVFLIQSEGLVANHVAIYLGNDMILHQLHGRISKRDVYGGYWRKHTVAHLRHQQNAH